MIVASVLRSVLRRWYVLLLGGVLIGVSYAGLAHNSASYQSVSTVLFVGPGKAPIIGFEKVQQVSLVAFASTIESQMNDGRDIDRLSSSSATLFGVGVRNGYQVAVPNQGGQWNYYFPTPSIEIQVVGPDATKVVATRNVLVDRINAYAVADQKKLGVSPSRMITGQLTTSAQDPQYVGATHAMRMRGLLALSLVGIFLSVSAATLLDRGILRQRASTSDSRSTTRFPAPRPSSPSPRPAPLWKNSSL